MGGAGNDRIFGNRGNDLILAGSGNDRVHGNKGHDVIVAADGNDFVMGGAGRDVVIGGSGSDRLFGNRGQDLMISGRTIYDDDPQALGKVLAEWTSARSVQQRRENLLTGGGPLLDGVRLIPGETVLNEVEKDVVNSGREVDFVFTSAADIIRGNKRDLLERLP